MAYDSNGKKSDSVYSQRVRAGKRRTYFFDVRETRGNDYYLTITESRKKFNEEGYDRHKLFLYKEDFNKFLKGMTEAIDYVKKELMPDFDFDSFSHEDDDEEKESESSTTTPAQAKKEEPQQDFKSKETPGDTDKDPDAADSGKDEHADKW